MNNPEHDDRMNNGAMNGMNNKQGYEQHLQGNQNWTGNGGENKPQAQKAISTKNWGNDGDVNVSKGSVTRED
jgi:hypothetical protein